MVTTLLEEKLGEIASSIEANYKTEEHIGALSGLSGIALFQFYYAKYTDNNAAAQLGMEMISHCVEKVNEGYTFPTFCTGIAGFGWVLEHLKEKDMIDSDNDELLAPLDNYLYSIMANDMKKGYYDYLHGAIGYALFFLKRFQNTDSDALRKRYRTFLDNFIQMLRDLSELDGSGGLRWKSDINYSEPTRGYNLSLSHGISAIIAILTKLFLEEEFRDQSSDLLLGALKYVQSQQSKDFKSFSLFPNYICIDEKKDEPSRLAWCYGDLGIGYQFWQASKVLKDEKLQNQAIEIFMHAARRKSPDQSFVMDADICHGAFGIGRIFRNIHWEKGIDELEEAASYWIKTGLDMGNYSDGFGGFKHWDGRTKDWSNKLSVLEGVAGIGLISIDLISEFNSSWDECLLLK